ncbi:MAG TPA: hypothetical protein VLX28_10890 [Thermoanaerobaculia bacterium]|nr:hypothetical protein [Thermoanaerobaculia bacterium]
MTIPAAAPPSSRWPAAVCWFVLVLFLFPGVGSSLGRGLEPSWAYAVNALSSTGRLPGRDVAFTYGPLGWLFAPANLGHHLFLALLFWLGMHALFALALARVLRRTPAFGALAFTGFLLASHTLGLGADYGLVLTLGLLLLPDLLETAAWRVPWAPALASALAVVFGLIKLSFGLSAVALLGSFALVAFARRRPGRGRLLAAMAGGAIMALAVAVPLVFEGLGNAWRWLGLQGELAHGYAAGMALPAGAADLASGLVALALVTGLFLAARAKGSALAVVWAMFLLPVWLAFQHGFIRGDAAHTVAFFPFVLGVTSLGLLCACGPVEKRAAGGAALLLLFLAAACVLRFGGVPILRSQLDVLLGARGLRNLSAAMQPIALQRRVARDQERALAPSRLPEDFVAPVRAAGLGVDVLPWELSYIPANGLRWVPSPTLQLYATLTRRLDALTARHFANAAAPDLLLAQGNSIDGRNLLWDTPETWRAILAAYELDPRRPAPDLLALRRRPQPLAWRLEPRGEIAAPAGRWLDVPGAAAGSWTFAALELSPGWQGRVDRWLLGLPPILLETVDDRGTHRTVRILSETAPGGLLMVPFASNLDELAALWNAPAGLPRLVRFRLAGPGLRVVAAVKVRWLAASPPPSR